MFPGQASKRKQSPMNRLATHVLLPLIAGGLVLLTAVAGIATFVSRDTALHQLDARAGTYRAASEAALVRTGRLGPVAVAARGEGVGLALVPADKPLPGGMTVVSAGGERVYTYPVRSRHGRTRRGQITLRDGEIASATWHALGLSLRIGVPVLVLLLLAVGL